MSVVTPGTPTVLDTGPRVPVELSLGAAFLPLIPGILHVITANMRREYVPACPGCQGA